MRLYLFLVDYHVIKPYVDSKLEDKRFCTEAFPDFNFLLIST